MRLTWEQDTPLPCSVRDQSQLSCVEGTQLTTEPHPGPYKKYTLYVNKWTKKGKDKAFQQIFSTFQEEDLNRSYSKE